MLFVMSSGCRRGGRYCIEWKLIGLAVHDTHGQTATAAFAAP